MDKSLELELGGRFPICAFLATGKQIDEKLTDTIKALPYISGAVQVVVNGVLIVDTQNSSLVSH